MSQRPVPGTDPALSEARITEFQNERERSGPLRSPLFGLAPDGVFRASALALGAVGSYSTFSPSLRPREREPGQFVFCGTVRRDASRRRLPRVSSARPRLRGIAPFGVRTFLPPTGAGERFSALPKSRGSYPRKAARATAKDREHRRLAGVDSGSQRKGAPGNQTAPIFSSGSTSVSAGLWKRDASSLM